MDLTAGGYRLGQFSNTNREGWKIDTAANTTVVLTNSIAAGATYLVAHSAATNPAYAAANQIASWGFNGDDSVVLYTGTTYAFANVVDAFGLTNTTTAFGENKSFVRKNTVTTGVNTDFNAAEWDEFTLAAVDAAAESTNERLGYHSTGEPPAPQTNVKFTATAAAVNEDAGTYQVTVVKTLAEGNVSGEIGLSGTATYGAGADYTMDTTNFTMNGATTSAVFTVTINDDEDEEGAETIILTLANVTGGTAGSPSVFTLTVNANDVPPEGIVEFRFNTAPYLQATSKDANLTVSNMSLTAGTIEQNVTTGDYFPDEPYIEESTGWTADNQAAAKAFQFTVTPAEGYAVTVTGVSFRAYATPAGPSAVGFDIGGITTHAENLTNAVLLHVNQGVADVLDRTEPFLVKIQGWTNGTRVSAGTGVFRLDDVVLYGTVISQGAGTPPVLNAIGSKSVALNGTLQFFVAATPTEGDAVSLTASNLPAGAFFYPTNEVGSFFWQNASPTGAYSVTFNAADDDGADAETITITVTPAVGEPEVTRFVLTAGATPSVTLTETQVGVTYALEFTTSLKDPEPIWTEVDSEPGNGGQITLADPNPAAGMRIYRVITR